MEMNLAARSTALRRRENTRATDPDAELVRAAQADPREFVALYERYFTRVFGYVCVRIADRASAEDVTGHILATGLAKIRSFRGHGPFAAWLFQIARNAVRDERSWSGGLTSAHLALCWSKPNGARACTQEAVPDGRPRGGRRCERRAHARLGLEALLRAPLRGGPAS
jgi:hypothetical protein